MRDVLVGLSRNCGYEVFDAADGKSALAVLEGNRNFDLFFADVVMPRQMNGIELAEQALRRNPGLKVIFNLGYATRSFSAGSA